MRTLPLGLVSCTPLPRHWHGAIRPSVSESKQMRQKTGCGGCCCCEEEEEAAAAGSARRPAAATLGVGGSDADDSAPASRAEAGAEAQRIEAVPRVFVVGAAVSPATPGGRNGGQLPTEREREREREDEKRERSGVCLFRRIVSRTARLFFSPSSSPLAPNGRRQRCDRGQFLALQLVVPLFSCSRVALQKTPKRNRLSLT
jgi:hypothetical protein